jgi:RNA polymerase sigma factor (TIGR02999 family)
LATDASKPEPASGDRQFGAAYDELRRLAGAYLHRERSGHSLQATELVNEAYLRVGRADILEGAGRTHFFAVAARAMRRVLVDHARARGRLKRSGGAARVTLGDNLGPMTEIDLDTLVDLDRAIDRLAALDPRQAKVVELRFFSGLGMSEVADALGISKRSAEGDWAHARVWLRREMNRSRGE